MATGDLVIRDSATAAAPKSTEVSGAADFVLLAVQAELDGSGAAGAFLPTLEIVAPGGVVTARIPAPVVAAGGSAEVTWAPFLETDEEPDLFPRNMGELGMSGAGTLGNIYDHTIRFEDVQIGDGILVLAMAPSVSAAAATPRTPSFCDDSVGNFYVPLSTHFFEAAVPNVNEGARLRFFYCSSSIAPLVAGVDFIEATWGGNVFDRSIAAWLVRHDGGAGTPTLLAATADNDAAAFAATSMTLQSPAFTPARDNGLTFAALFTAKAGGIVGWSGIFGWNGYLQVSSGVFSGSKQIYRINEQTFGANALLINEFGGTVYEIDLGQLPGGVPIAAFNGVGQNYVAGANAWKGIVIWEID